MNKKEGIVIKKRYPDYLLRWILGIAAGMLLVHLAWIGLGAPDLKLVEIPFFIPNVHLFGIFESITITILALVHHRTLLKPASFWVAFGFMFYAFTNLFFILSWPGLRQDGSAFIGVLPDTSAWIIMIGQLGFISLLLIACVARWPSQMKGRLNLLTQWPVLVVVSCLANIIPFFLQGRLPTLVSSAGAYLPLLSALNVLVLCLYAIGAGLAALRYRRTSDPLVAYLALDLILLTASSFESLLGGQRYSFLWYTSRITAILGGIFVLSGLLFEYVSLFRSEVEKTRKLAEAVYERKQAENALRLLNADLETRVAEQTQELRSMNTDLEQRIALRTADLEIANAHLADSEQGERQRAAQLDALIDVLPEPVLLYDVQGKPVRVNFATVELTGVDVNGEDLSLVGQALAKLEICDGEGQPMQLDKMPFQRALFGESVRKEVLQWTNLNGQQVIVETNADPLPGGGAVVVWHDITDRKRVERRLEQLNNELEGRVKERTAELVQTNQALQAEIHDRELVEKALQEKTAELDRYFITALDLFCIADAQGNFKRLNPQWRTTFGYELEELIGQSFENFVHPDELDETRRVISSLASQASIPVYVNRFRCKDGDYRWIEWSLLFQSGLIYAAARDISERKQVEQALRENDAALNEAQRVGRLGSWDWDAVTDKITWSREYYHIYGFDPDLPPPGYSEHLKAYTPESAARLDAAVKISMETGIPYDLDLERVNSDGSHQWINARCEIKRDANRRIVGLRGTAQDITERKQADKARQEILTRLETLVENVQQGILFENQQRMVQFSNRAFCAMFGISSPQAIFGSDCNLMAMQSKDYFVDPQEFIETIQMRLTQRKTVHSEELHLQDGRIFERDYIPVDFDGRQFGNYWIYRDISERRQAEKDLHATHQQLESIFDQTHVMIAFLDPQFRFVRINSAFAHANAVEPSTYIGQNYFTLFPNPEMERIFLTVVERGEPFDAYEQQFHAAGEDWNSARYLDWSLVPILDENKAVSGLILTLADVTERVWAEIKLRASEHKFKTLFEIAPVGISLLDDKRRVIASNKMYEKFSRLTHDDFPLENHSAPRYLREDGTLMPAVEYAGERVFREGKPILNVVTGIIGENAQTVWTQVSAAPLDLPDASAVLVTQDITEQKRVQRALLDASIYNRNLIEASLDPLVTIGPDGKITDVNTSTETVTGCTREELIGTDFCDYFTEPEKARSGYQQVFRDGMVRDYPLEIVHRTGRITSVLYNASVYHDPNGNITGVFAAARDITERKIAEAEREQYYKFFETSPDLMVMADPNGAFLKTNPACSQVLGYSAEELVSRPFVEFVHPEDQQFTLDEMARQIRLGYSLNFENRYVCKNGTSLWLSWRAQYNRLDGITYATAHDITERKRANEKLQAALDEKETLLREIHHRVKNNLQAIIALMEMHEHQIEDPTALVFLKELQGQARTMSLVYEQLYQSANLARVELKAYLGPLTEHILESFGQGRHYQLTLDIDDISLDVAQAMPCGLIINELFTNILKHAFPPNFTGDREITIRLHQVENTIHLTVGDNGVGIPQRFDLAASRSLGLHLVHLWVTHQLGGSIELQTGPGTKFEIEFMI